MISLNWKTFFADWVDRLSCDEKFSSQVSAHTSISGAALLRAETQVCFLAVAGTFCIERAFAKGGERGYLPKRVTPVTHEDWNWDERLTVTCLTEVGCRTWGNDLSVWSPSTFGFDFVILRPWMYFSPEVVLILCFYESFLLLDVSSDTIELLVETEGTSDILFATWSFYTGSNTLGGDLYL